MFFTMGNFSNTKYHVPKQSSMKFIVSTVFFILYLNVSTKSNFQVSTNEGNKLSSKGPKSTIPVVINTWPFTNASRKGSVWVIYFANSFKPPN